LKITLNANVEGMTAMTFARWTFRLAGLYGLLVTIPLYFSEGRIGRDFPPAITHPDLFYGFIGVVVAWQVAFLVMACEPARFRPLMLVAVLEKLGYGGAAAVLFYLHRVPAPVFAFGLVDLLLGALFLVAFWKTRRDPSSNPG
jgi:hypothetical protein